MSAVTVRVLDSRLAAVQYRINRGRPGLGPVAELYADALSKAPRLVLAGHLARLTLAALTGRTKAATPRTETTR